MIENFGRSTGGERAPGNVRLTRAEASACTASDGAAGVALESFLARTEKNEWERRRILTAILWHDMPTISWFGALKASCDENCASLRVTATIRAWSDAATNMSQLVWHGTVAGFAALETVRTCFDVAPDGVFIDPTWGESATVAYCARYGAQTLCPSPRKSFMHRRTTAKPKHPYSELHTLRGVGVECANRYWSMPLFGGYLWACLETRCAHKWLLPGGTPPDYVSCLQHGLREYQASPSPQEFMFQAAQPWSRPLFGAWLTESAQVAAYDITGGASIFRRAYRHRQ